MAISENCLIISYDDHEGKIVIRRPSEVTTFEKIAVLHTEYLLSKIKSMKLNTACQLLGEDILISLAGTRSLFKDSAPKGKVNKRAKKNNKRRGNMSTST